MSEIYKPFSGDPLKAYIDHQKQNYNNDKRHIERNTIFEMIYNFLSGHNNRLHGLERRVKDLENIIDSVETPNDYKEDESEDASN